MKDANDNLTAIAFDARGLPTSMAVMGKLIAMPPGKTDETIDQPWEKAFTGKWTAKNLTFGAEARHIYGLPPSDPSGTAAQTEVNHYLELHDMTLDGSITDAPNSMRSCATDKS